MNAKNLFYIWIWTVIISLVGIVSCTSLSDLEDRIARYSTNTVIVTNDNMITTNLVVVTNIIKISDTFYQTNIVVSTHIIYTNTNFIYKGVDYQPVPSKIYIYIDSGVYGGVADTPQVYWWSDDGSSDVLSMTSNMNDGYVNWWVFVATNIDIREPFEIKFKNSGAWENINGGNGGNYKRVVVMPILTKEVTTMTNTTNGSIISNIVTTSFETYDKVFVYPPLQWYQAFPYLLENETNIYVDPSEGGSFLWNQYMGANYWGSGVTFFTLYAPNVRRAWVGGDFNSWEKIPLNLSTDKTWWWACVSNTQPGQAYKFVVEKYRWTNHHWLSDPAAKKNEHNPAMDSSGNKSYIVDHGAYQWSDGTWGKPGFEYYTIYQMHMRTFCTQGEGSYWGWGTFVTATNKFNYIKDLGFTAIEPLPIHEFAGDQSWGYNYTLFYAPETAYTASVDSVDPFKVFVDTAHQKGLAVIIDLVFNHMGASDDIIGALDPAADWNSPDTFFYKYKTDWGPRFNYANPVVKKFLTDSAVYLMQYYHVDGFRFDATYYIHWNDPMNDGGSFLYNMTRDIKNRAQSMPGGGNVLLVAENLPNDDWITGEGGFNFQWDADMAHELKKLFSSGPISVSVSHLSDLLQTPNRVQYMVSHDEAANGKERTAADLHYVRGWANDEYDAEYQQITGLATVLMGAGMPMMFMGDEFLEGFYDDDYWGPPYNARYFVDWKTLSWNNDYYARTDGYPARWRAAATVQAVRDLAWVRRNYGAVHWYDITVTHVNDTDKVIGFQRGGDIFVVINYNKVSYSTYSPAVPGGTWDLIFASPSGAYGDAIGYLTSTVSGGGNISIPEYGVLVYKKR